MSDEPCPSCERDLSYPGKPGHACYTRAKVEDLRAELAGERENSSNAADLEVELGRLRFDFARLAAEYERGAESLGSNDTQGETYAEVASDIREILGGTRGVIAERIERGPIWGRTYGFSIPVRIHPSEESARAAAADVSKGGQVVVWRNAENGWEEAPEPHTYCRPETCGGSKIDPCEKAAR